MAEKTTVSSLMREWTEHLTEEVSAFTVVPEGSCDTDKLDEKDVQIYGNNPSSFTNKAGRDAKAPIRVKRSEMAGAANNAYAVRRKNIDTLMKTTGKLLKALDKAAKKDGENWGHVGTAGAIEDKLGDINQMLKGI